MSTADTINPRSSSVQEDGFERRGTPSAAPNNARIFYRDFRPQPDPNSSTCFSTGYQSFRGLRVWLRRTTESEQERLRILLGYRDFAPNLEDKSLLDEDWDSVEVLLERVNAYLQDRSTSSKIINVETLDTVVEGIMNIDTDTEESLLKFSQNGFTRFCRFIRVFFLTALRVNHTTKTPFGDKPGTFLLLRDFRPHPDEWATKSDAISKMLSHVGRHIAKLEKDTEVVSISVIQLRVGSCPTSTTWRLESPFYCPNKFTFLVRVACKAQRILPAYTSETVYITGSGIDREKKSETDDKDNKEDTDKQEKTQADSENDVETYQLPGVVDSAQEVDLQPGDPEKNSTQSITPSKDKEVEGLQVQQEKSAEDSEELEGIKDCKDGGVIKIDVQALQITESKEGNHCTKLADCDQHDVGKEETKLGLQDLCDTVRCHSFVPKRTSTGYCSSTKWEPFDSVAQRVIDSLWHVNNPILALHTHQLYCPGGIESPGAAVWTQHAASGGLLGILHLFLRGELQETSTL